ncbi:S8 family serine peptidase [candidate division KSB1 bacterium]|nr:S8 family serine peptidase [candidate division KSB1 bacterium]
MGDATARHLAVSDRSLKRRLKVHASPGGVDFRDLPVHAPYIETLERDGIAVITKSRWLNAVSARVPAGKASRLENYPFIKKIQRVGQYRRRPVEGDEKQPPAFPIFKSTANRLDYGMSLTQNALMQVPEVHDLGINGTNVIIGLLDTGFNYRQHSAFAFIDVIDEFDFLNSDNVTQNENSEIGSDQHNHGTMTLAVAGGFQEGSLIGPAYRSKFLLAKTEDHYHEDIIEEDYWVAGLEWLERNGADIVSSSLGYDDWYSYENLDGNTAITTIAADIAVKKGVLVVNSIGNEGQVAGSIIAPADADSAIAVGSVTSRNTLSYFSSIGPTYDQRIKPEVVAMGSQVYTVVPNSNGEFISKNGTSFACPLVAGIAALILSAHPELTPMQVRDALCLTADRAQQPDNYYGWGLVNALDAVLHPGIVFSNLPTIQQLERNRKAVMIRARSKYGIIPDSVAVFFSSAPDSFVRYPLRATDEVHEFGAEFSLDGFGETVNFYFSAIDSMGHRAFYPFDAPKTTFNTQGGIIIETLPSAFHLYQNIPNPFVNSTLLQYDLPAANHVLLEIYNIRGRLVKKLVDEEKKPGQHSVVWNGRNSAGQLVANGVYEARFHSAYFTARRMMDLARIDMLQQNHPNPFNQATTIRYELQQPAHIRLNIYNTAGQLVTTLVDEQQQPATYKILWNGLNQNGTFVSSGVYVYELRMDEIITCRKMICLR